MKYDREKVIPGRDRGPIHAESLGGLEYNLRLPKSAQLIVAHDEYRRFSIWICNWTSGFRGTRIATSADFDQLDLIVKRSVEAVKAEP